ncbi:class I SAM-dependent methyltransferase [Flavobacterium sp. ZT3R18]|uniref:class I SAM-dependent methyltransferase n=1 Tax=Flavobacterium sp. ZT3R18 TaxID=2594429 RepID=UPI001179D75C|nr:class I SAM-dependent methyltransferase [Flavobacterium sp. ZT3R18]TRX34851.1 class I SAM-dependent methyltransferase [Flavobacterium sp. ZT3R18]
MKVGNKDFWENENIIKTQDISKNISNFEAFMFEKAKERYKAFGKIKNIKVFGCGTGREIKSIVEIYHPSRIVASDISENMISKCKKNLEIWKMNSITETIVGNALDFNKVSCQFELVTVLNSMLTYVPERNNRLGILKNAHQILKDDGVMIGTVHNQVGTLTKTLYFKIRNFFSVFLGENVGNRDTGFNGLYIPGYYYAKKGLLEDIEESGFKNIEVYSLEEFSILNGTSYNRKKGYNNLIFIASK